jgi:hypothetical protein
MKRSGNSDGQAGDAIHDQRIPICEVVSIARVMRLTRLPSFRARAEAVVLRQAA